MWFPQGSKPISRKGGDKKDKKVLGLGEGGGPKGGRVGGWRRIGEIWAGR